MPIRSHSQKELPFALADDGGGEAEEEGDDQVLVAHAPHSCRFSGMGLTSRRTGEPQAGVAGTDNRGNGPGGLLLRIGHPSGDSERDEAEAAPPQAPARLEEGQALPLGPRRRRRLAGRGLHRPPQAQAAAAPLSRSRARSRRDRDAAGRPGQPGSPPGRAPTRGRSGATQAVRLLDRAGFGAVPGQAEQLASLGLVGAVQSLTRPSGAATLTGPAPVDDDGDPIAPADAWGHDHLWWLDRMVRTDQPLVERMALVFHDWFATSNASVSDRAADDRPVEPLPLGLLRLLPRPLHGGDGRPGDAAVAERRPKTASRPRTRTTAAR